MDLKYFSFLILLRFAKAVPVVPSENPVPWDQKEVITDAPDYSNSSEHLVHSEPALLPNISQLNQPDNSSIFAIPLNSTCRQLILNLVTPQKARENQVTPIEILPNIKQKWINLFKLFRATYPQYKRLSWLTQVNLFKQNLYKFHLRDLELFQIINSINKEIDNFKRMQNGGYLKTMLAEDKPNNYITQALLIDQLNENTARSFNINAEINKKSKKDLDFVLLTTDKAEQLTRLKSVLEKYYIKVHPNYVSLPWEDQLQLFKQDVLRYPITETERTQILGIIDSGLIDDNNKNKTPESVDNLENIPEAKYSLNDFRKNEKNYYDNRKQKYITLSSVQITKDNHNRQDENNNYDFNTNDESLPMNSANNYIKVPASKYGTNGLPRNENLYNDEGNKKYGSVQIVNMIKANSIAQDTNSNHNYNYNNDASSPSNSVFNYIKRPILETNYDPNDLTRSQKIHYDEEQFITDYGNRDKKYITSQSVNVNGADTNINKNYLNSIKIAQTGQQIGNAETLSYSQAFDNIKNRSGQQFDIFEPTASVKIHSNNYENFPDVENSVKNILSSKIIKVIDKEIDNVEANEKSPNEPGSLTVNNAGSTAENHFNYIQYNSNKDNTNSKLVNKKLSNEVNSSRDIKKDRRLQVYNNPYDEYKSYFDQLTVGKNVKIETNSNELIYSNGYEDSNIADKSGAYEVNSNEESEEELRFTNIKTQHDINKLVNENSYLQNMDIVANPLLEVMYPRVKGFDSRLLNSHMQNLKHQYNGHRFGNMTDDNFHHQINYIVAPLTEVEYHKAKGSDIRLEHKLKNTLKHRDNDKRSGNLFFYYQPKNM